MYAKLKQILSSELFSMHKKTLKTDKILRFPMQTNGATVQKTISNKKIIKRWILSKNSYIANTIEMHTWLNFKENLSSDF